LLRRREGGNGSRLGRSWRHGGLLREDAAAEAQVELLGAGLTHPNVLAYAGIDPKVWSGFAFGMGVERIAMMVSQTPDLRFFFENDQRFLKTMGGLD